MKPSLLLIISTVLVFISCDSGQRYQSVLNDFEVNQAAVRLQYEGKAVKTAQGLSLFAALYILENGEYEVHGMLDGDDQEKVTIHCSEAQIALTDGTRSTTLSADCGSQNTEAGRYFVVKFNPVNSRWLFHQYGLKGDAQPVYSMNLGFLELESKRLENYTYEFRSEEQEYQAYLSNYGFEDQLTKFTYAIDQEAFANQQMQYWDENIQEKSPNDEAITEHTGIPTPPNQYQQFVQISDQEIAINGMAITLSSYQKADSLHLNLRLVNHSNHILSVKPSHCNVSVNSNILTPEGSILLDQRPLDQSWDEVIKLRKGGRFQGKFTYYTPQGLEEFSFSTDGIFVDTLSTKLFYDNLHLRKIVGEEENL
ncbi:MAG: hypothetical protein AAFX87_14425 [Bacteroidota bacterium]